MKAIRCWLVTLLFLVAYTAFAQTYPSKPVKVVVPYVPGGATDIAGRIMAQALTQALGQSFVVENRPGVGGLTALELVAKSAPDGYTLVVGTVGPLTVSPTLFKERAFDTLEQLEPIIWFANTPGIIVVRNGLKANDVPALVALSKANPDSLSMASAGAGSIQHLMGAYFQDRTGIKWLHVPYKGSIPALTDLVAGRVDLMLDVVPSAAPFVKSGKLRALAVTTQKRSTQMPEVPTLEELGIKGFDIDSWWALLGPKGTSRDIVAKLNAELDKSLKTAEILARLASIGAEPGGGAPDRLAERIRAETSRWAEIIRTSGTKPD